MKKFFVALSIPLLALVLAACSVEDADPTATILDIVVAFDDTATLEDAAGAADPAVVETLAGAGSLTLFAPTEDGFASALDFIAGVCEVDSYTATDLLGVDTALLTTILQYHVVGAEAFAADLVDGQVLTMAAGGPVTVSLDDGPQLIDGLGRTIDIVRTDLDASNGVVHYIGDVLIPAAAAEADLNCP